MKVLKSIIYLCFFIKIKKNLIESEINMNIYGYFVKINSKKKQKLIVLNLSINEKNKNFTFNTFC